MEYACGALRRARRLHLPHRLGCGQTNRVSARLGRTGAANEQFCNINLRRSRLVILSIIILNSNLFQSMMTVTDRHVLSKFRYLIQNVANSNFVLKLAKLCLVCQQENKNQNMLECINEEHVTCCRHILVYGLECEFQDN